MKIILTSTSPNLDADLDPRFGRCSHLITFDTETMEWNAASNPGASAPGGAGIQAAQNVDAVASGHFGPNAFTALQAAGIRMYRFGSCRTIKEMLEEIKMGSAQRVDKPTRSTCNPGRDTRATLASGHRS